MSNKKNRKDIVTKETMELTEYHCFCCRENFYIKLTGGYPERCFNCGSTSEVCSTRHLVVTIDKTWLADS